MSGFSRLVSYFRPYRTLVGVAILCNILAALFTVVSIPLLDPFFDLLFEKAELVSEAPATLSSREDLRQQADYFFSNLIVERGRPGALTVVCGMILAAFLGKNLFRYLALFCMAPVRTGIIRDLRNQIYGHLMGLPLSYFSEERKGHLLSRITTDVQEVEASILNVLEAVFREPFIIAGSLTIMLVISPTLTVFVFGLMLFTGVVIGGLGKRLKRNSEVVQERLGDIVSRTEEGLGGLRIIKSFGAEGYQRGVFGTLNDSYRHHLIRLLWRRDLSSPLTEFLGIATVALLLWYGSRQVFSGELEAGTFLSFIFAFYMVIDPAKNFAKAYYNVRKGLGAVARVQSVLDARNPIAERAGQLRAGPLGQGVRFERVSFRYAPDAPDVLHEVSFDLPRGQVVALAGGSGGGKSTIADLLPRFYDPTGGRITLDGRDLREYDLKSLRRRFGIVSQEAILFNDTIYNNIVFGLEDVTPAQVEEAARIANAHDFILATPRGYDTIIGDRGSKLSGGQRQRLTIARAVLRDPDILILDEATSALDTESERLVQAALERIMRGRTALVIAHRLSTIRGADQILVLDKGVVVERGRHEELVGRAGVYGGLYGN